MEEYDKADVVWRPIEDLTKLANNPRTITKEEMDKLMRSIKRNKKFFSANPLILSDRTGELVIIGGNQRLEAAKRLGLTEVPTILMHNPTEREERETVILDNHSNGEYDMDMLANEYGDLDLEELMGNECPKEYQTKEIIEDEPDPIEEETFSVVGDIYQLGEHRIFCGSFEDKDGVNALFGNKKATCTFTDPPYNVAVKNRSTGKTIQNDSMKEDEFQDFLNRAFECVAQNMVPGGGVISWMSDKEILTLKNAMDRAGMNFKTVLCWVKDHFTLGGNDFQSAKELAIYATGEGKSPDPDDYDELDESQYAIYARGKEGKFTDSRKLSNVWYFAKPKSSKDHPTMKPVGLCAKGVLAMAEPGDIVFDPFSGSGSTLMACEQTDRICYGCEIDSRYCDVIIRRWEKFTGKKAKLISKGEK